jgi:hypothetical protein
VLPLGSGLTGAAALGPEELAGGFRTAMFVAGATSAAGGLLAVLTIRNPARTGAPADDSVPSFSCALGGPPLRPSPLAPARPR